MINGRLSSKILIFRAAYNKRGATLKHPMPGQACSRKAFRASFTLGAALCIPHRKARTGEAGGGYGGVGAAGSAAQTLTLALCAPADRFSFWKGDGKFAGAPLRYGPK